MVHLGLVLDVGRSDDPEGFAGLAHAAAHVWDEGRSDGVRRGAEIEALGEWRFNVGTDVTTMTLATPRVLLGDALQVLATVFADPMPPGSDERLQHTLGRMAVEWQQREDGGGDSDIAYLFPALFGPTHPYAQAVDSSPLDYVRIDAHALKAFYTAEWRPDNATLHITGDVGLEEAAAAVDAAIPALGGARRCPNFAATDNNPPVMPPRPATVARTARVSSRTLDIAWTLPAGLGRQDYLVELLAEVVTGHTNGVYCRTQALREAAVLWCSGPLKSNAVPMEAADEVLDALEALGTRVWLPRDSLRGQVFRWLDGPLSGSGDNYVLLHQHRNEGVDARLDALTTLDGARPEAVRDFTGAWLTRQRAVVGVVEPGPSVTFTLPPPELPVRGAAPTPVAGWVERMLATTPEPLHLAQRTLRNGALAVAVQVPGAVATTVQVLARGGNLAGSRPRLASVVDWTDAWRILNDGSDFYDRLTQSFVKPTAARGDFGWSDGWSGPNERLGPMVWVAWKRMQGVRRKDEDPAVAADKYGIVLRALRLEPKDAAAAAASETLADENPWITASLNNFRGAQKASAKDWRAVSEGLRQPDNTTILVVGGVEPEGALDRVEAIFASWPVRKAELPPAAWEPLPIAAPGGHATMLDDAGVGTAEVALACRLAAGAPDALIEELARGAAAERLAEEAGLEGPPGVLVRASPLHAGILLLSQPRAAMAASASADGLLRWVNTVASIGDDGMVRGVAAQAIARGLLGRASVEGTSIVLRDALLTPGGLAQLTSDAAALRSATAADLRARMAPCLSRRELAVIGGTSETEAGLRKLGLTVTRRPFAAWLDAHAPPPED